MSLYIAILDVHTAASMESESTGLLGPFDSPLKASPLAVHLFPL